MKTLSINIRTDRTPTKEDILYAMVNREEELQNKSIQYPPLKHKKMDMVVNRVVSHSFFSKFLP